MGVSYYLHSQMYLKYTLANEYKHRDRSPLGNGDVRRAASLRFYLRKTKNKAEVSVCVTLIFTFISVCLVPFPTLQGPGRGATITVPPSAPQPCSNPRPIVHDPVRQGDWRTPHYHFQLPGLGCDSDIYNQV